MDLERMKKHAAKTGGIVDSIYFSDEGVKEQTAIQV
jgi:hypothetical protein